MRVITVAGMVLALGCGGRYESGGRDDSVGRGGSGPLSDAASGVSAAGTTAPEQSASGVGGTYSSEVGGSSPASGGTPSTAGVSGTGTVGSGPSVCDGKTFRPVAYIDNFETDARLPGWYAFSDTNPPNMPLPGRVMSGALSTRYAGHFSAAGIRSSQAMGYGAGFGFGIVDPARGNCVDVSDFIGISFWVKGTAGTDDTLKFQIVSALTQPADSQPPGDCPSSASSCAYKHPAKTIVITEGWKHVVINFADLAPAAAFAPSKVMGFNLLTDGPDYDVELDEVTFFTNAAPTGPVNP